MMTRVYAAPEIKLERKTREHSSSSSSSRQQLRHVPGAAVSQPDHDNAQLRCLELFQDHFAVVCLATKRGFPYT